MKASLGAPGDPPPPVTTNAVVSSFLIAPPKPLGRKPATVVLRVQPADRGTPPSPIQAPPVGSGFSLLSNAPSPQSVAAPTNSTLLTNAPVSESTNVLVSPPVEVAVPAGTTVPEPASATIQWPLSKLPGPMVSLKEWADVFGASAPRRIADAPHPTYEVRCPAGAAVIRVGTSRVTIRGIDVMIGHPAQFVGGEPCLHRLDYIKTLHPLLWPPVRKASSTRGVVVIDPGHGGKDVGTGSVDGRQFEKKMTLDWALRLKSLVERQGYKVLLTRTNDVEIPLAQRVFLAEQAKAAFFVSLHFNSAYPVQSRRGLETYALTPAGMASSVVRDGEDNQRLIFPNNAHDPSNLRLAWAVQQSVVQTTGAVDRGVQRARFMGVLRGQNRPAILVEGGYLSNPEEAKKISDSSYRQRLAEGVANAIKSFSNEVD